MTTPVPEPISLVLLHGAGQTSASWDGVVDALPSHVDVYALDLRLDTSFTLLAATRAVIAHVDELNHQRVVLCGLSLGAIIAALTAAERPKRVAALALSAIQVRPNPILMRIQRTAIRVTPARLIETQTGPSKRDLLHVLDAVAGIDLTHTLPQLPMPTLVLCGTNDRSNLRATRRAARLLPNATLEIVQHVGHEWNRTHPQLYARTLARLLHKNHEQPDPR